MTAPTGRLVGVGLGPGDPELVTMKAARLIAEADVVAYHQGPTKRSNARRTADPYIRPGAIEELLKYPVTTGTTDHPGGYAGAMADFYADCAERLAAHLDAGRLVVVLAEGDPLLYSSFMYVHDRLRERYQTEVVPGVPAFAAATAALGVAVARQADILTILQGTLDRPELARRLADTDAAIIMKLGRRFADVRAALEESGRLEDAWYVERASMDNERWMRAADVDPGTVPYFSIVVVPGDASERRRRYDDPHASAPASVPGVAELFVVGLGPGPNSWLTAEAVEVLANVDHVVGYGPYVARVPTRAGQQRHASGNTVEVERARTALELARRGERVVVVSGGDAGVFGMASAVFEAAEDPAFADISIRVIPGISAVQAVAARAGAPIGADFAVISLSDRLKPWSVIESRLEAIAEADLVLAVYNPRSRSRTDSVDKMRDILARHRGPDTVVIVGRDVGGEAELLTVTTLAALDTETIDMRCLIIVGATRTQVTATGRAWTPRYVEESSEV